MQVCLSTSNQDSLIHAWDIHSATLLGSFKSNQSDSICTDSKWILAPQKNSSLLHCWDISKAALAFKFVLPEELSRVALSHSGSYLAGAGVSGKIYFWDWNKGQLLHSFDAHFQSISSLLFTIDDAFLVSGGHDGLIHIWSLSCLSSPQPSTLSGHTLPITDITSSLLLSKDTRLFSSSMDKTCRIWDLNEKSCLLSLSFPQPLTCLTVDPLESVIYAGSVSGVIYSHPLYQKSGLGKWQSVSESSCLESPMEFIGHSESINSLSLDFDGTRLISASSDKSVRVWDAKSRQSLRTFEHHKGPVTDLFIMTCPIDLFNSSKTHQVNKSLSKYPSSSFSMPIYQKFTSLEDSRD